MEQQNINIDRVLSRGISVGYNLDDVDDFDINTAIVLNRLRWLHTHTKRADGFTWQTANDWYEYTRLSEYQVKNSLDKLASLGIIELKNTYITGTQVKARHQRFLVSDSKETSESEPQKTLESQTQETIEPVYNKEHNKEHNILLSKDNNSSPSASQSVLEPELTYEPLPEFAIKPKKLGRKPFGNPDVQRLMDVFEDYLGFKLPKQKEERRKANIIIKKFGKDESVAMAKDILSKQGEKYFKQVSTPTDMYNKLAQIANYYKHHEVRNTKKGGIDLDD